MHPTAYADAEQFARKYLKPEHRLIADIGALDVNGTLKPIFAQDGRIYHGMDLFAGPNVDVVLTREYGWSEHFVEVYDVVVSTQTMEHVRHPWLWMSDLARIAKPGGLIYVCAPNTMPFHECPIDCWRVWPSGMRAVMEYVELDVIECYKNQWCDTTGIARKRIYGDK